MPRMLTPLFLSLLGLVNACSAVSALSVSPGSSIKASGLVEVPVLSGAGGTVVVAGGNISDDDRTLWSALNRYAAAGTGHAHPRIAVVGSARQSLSDASKAFEESEGPHMGYRQLFETYGFEPVFVPIAIDNYRTAANDPANVKLVSSCDAVWFGGGNQAFHARCFLKDDGTDTPLMTAVRGVLRRGGVLAGSSAGAAIQDARTYGEGTSLGYLIANQLLEKPLSAMHDRKDSYLDAPGEAGGTTTGFGFVADIDAAVDTHVNARGRYGRAMVAMHALKNRWGIALSENTALFVRNGRGKVYGADRVFLADASQATYAATGSLQVRDLLVSSLRQYDEMDFARDQVRSLSPALTQPTGTAYRSTDVLATDELPRTMEGLIGSQDASVTAVSQSRDAQAFAFEFSKGPDSRGYRSAAGAISVERLHLSVTPVSSR